MRDSRDVALFVRNPMVLRAERQSKIYRGLAGALSLAAPIAFATPAPADGKPPEALVAMRAAFAAAAKAKDAARLEALTAFPLANEVYQEPQSIARAAFPERVKEYAELSKCLATAPLSADPDTAKTTKLWLVDCDGISFYFGLREGQWRHVKFANANE